MNVNTYSVTKYKNSSMSSYSAGSIRDACKSSVNDGDRRMISSKGNSRKTKLTFRDRIIEAK